MTLLSGAVWPLMLSVATPLEIETLFTVPLTAFPEASVADTVMSSRLERAGNVLSQEHRLQRLVELLICGNVVDLAHFLNDLGAVHRLGGVLVLEFGDQHVHEVLRLQGGESGGRRG